MSKRRTKDQLRRELEQTQALLARYQAQEATAITSPVVGIEALRKFVDIGSLEQEHFWAILLNARQQVLKVVLVAKGTVASVDTHPRDIFREAVRMNAHALILAHNHPSENPEPSSADDALTDRMAEAGQLLGIPVLDHLVVTRHDAYSYAQRGRGPF